MWITQAAHYGGDIDEELAKAKLFWESTTSGVDPQRLEPEFWSASMVRPCPLQTTDLALTRVLGMWHRLFFSPSPLLYQYLVWRSVLTGFS